MEVRVVKKEWGTSRLVFVSDRVAIEEIDVVAGGFCSLHSHDRKHNAFIVVAGHLLVSQAIGSGLSQHVYSIMPGEQSIVIPARCKHRFRALKATVAVEVYTAIPGEIIDLHDIHRFEEGGVSDV